MAVSEDLPSDGSKEIKSMYPEYSSVKCSFISYLNILVPCIDSGVLKFPNRDEKARSNFSRQENSVICISVQ